MTEDMKYIKITKKDLKSNIKVKVDPKKFARCECGYLLDAYGLCTRPVLGV